MKTTLKRLLAAALCVVMCIALFTGCGKKANDKDEQGRTILSVGGWPSKEGKDLDRMNTKKSEFEAANPDVVIKGDVWAFDRKTFVTKAAGGQLPTYFFAGFTEVPGIIEGEYSADLTEALEKYGYIENLNPDILELVSTEEGIWAIPTSAYVLGLAFNTELMEQAGLMEADGTPKQPKDWYEVAEFATIIKEKTGKPGMIFPSANNVGGWIFNPVAWSFGVEFMKQDEDGNWKATFDTPEAVAALQYIKDLKWKYDVLPSNTLVDGTEYYKVFGTGNAGMLIAAGDYTRQVVKYGMKPEQIGIMAMPAGPKRHVTLMGGGTYTVANNATADQIDAAVRWHSVGFNYKLTNDVKKSMDDEIQKKLDEGQLVGVKTMSIWSTNSESLSYEHSLIDKNANANQNHVKLYNDFVTDCPAEIQAEVPVCAQELYGVLDGCIQEVLTNKDADCAKLIKEACADFQANYLDNY